MTNKYGQPVIAVDGTSASGKSTLSEELARIYGARRLEYSLFFRLIALHMLDQGFLPEQGTMPTAAQVAEAARFASHLTWDSVSELKNDDRLRSIDVSRTAPFFAGIPEVSASTDATLQALIDASRDRPVIAEGRTIGKYVYPAADVKLFVDAKMVVRGARRGAALRSKGKDISDMDVVEDLAIRDFQDQNRRYQPTGFDAAIHTKLDTTGQEISETLAHAMETIEHAIPALVMQRETVAQGFAKD